MSAFRTNITCCKNCAKRHMGCHSNCDDYKRESEELQASKAVLRAEQDAYVELTEYRKHNNKRRRPPKPKLD